MIRALDWENGTLTWQGQTSGIWLDLDTPTPEEIERLVTTFNINPLALEDALQVGHWSRFESYPEHLFLILRTLAEPASCTDRTERVSVFWFVEQQALITLHLEPVDYLNRVWTEVSQHSIKTPNQTLYNLLGAGIDTFFEYTDALQDLTDNLEEAMFDHGQSQAFVTQIFEYKHQILHTRRLTSNARESVSSLARHIASVQPEYAIYYRDNVDSLSRVYDTLDSAREILSSILEVQLSVQSNRMNAIMRTLTTVSTIFLPLTFLVGVWGMNFEHMPELHAPHGYLWAWLCMLGLGGSLSWYFSKKGWW